MFEQIISCVASFISAKSEPFFISVDFYGPKGKQRENARQIPNTIGIFEHFPFPHFVILTSNHTILEPEQSSFL